MRTISEISRQLSERIKNDNDDDNDYRSAVALRRPWFGHVPLPKIIPLSDRAWVGNELSRVTDRLSGKGETLSGPSEAIMSFCELASSCRSFPRRKRELRPSGDDCEDEDPRYTNVSRRKLWHSARSSRNEPSRGKFIAMENPTRRVPLNRQKRRDLRSYSFNYSLQS